MARVTTVQKARKAQGNCRRCGKPIEQGDTYRWFANRIGRMSVRKVFCAEHYPRASEMTTSDKLATLYAAQEDAQDALDSLGDEADLDDFESIRDNAAGTIRDVGQEYQESADNMVDGFGHDTYMSDEIAEKADAVDGWADEVENVDFDEFDEDEALIDFDEDEHRLPDTYDNGDPRPATEIEEALAEARKEHLAEKRDEWREEQAGKLEEALGECPV